MSASFVFIALIALVGAAGAVFLRQIVHCVLCLAVAFVGVSMLYLQLGAQFLGFAQILIYVGAVTILILFAILLTRNSGTNLSESPFSAGCGIGLLISGAVFACLVWAVRQSSLIRPAAETEVSVQKIGERLMTEYVLPLEVIALLLTVAMIGAVTIAMKEAPEANPVKESADKPPSPS